ncbi:MAG: SCP2 sterol-binding domain-containing protein [Candidatus Bathyarchaeia archaeon]|nr:SCP2 sterol-binding domain-containing protein [Candidatus Bathyarchaeia archaeon]
MTEAKTPKEFFEKVLPSRFNSEKAGGIDVIVQVSIVGPNGGDWAVTIKNQELKVEEGTHPSPTLKLKMAETDYINLVNGKISGEKAFLTGKLQFKGNIALALKLREAGFL